MWAALQYIFPGMWITLSVTIIALAMGVALGLLMAVVRVYGGPLFSWIATVYSIVVRAVPVVVIIFILYFVIAKFVDLSAFYSGSFALGFASGAYQTEIFRGAILSVPPNQMVAARAVGMGKWMAIRNIVLPQALRIAIPAWSNEVTLVLKDSSLIFVIGVPEILRRAQYISARTYEPFIAFGSAALLYFLLTLIASRALGAIEQRFRIVM